MLAGTDPETPLDRRRLSEFFAEPKNSHGASSVTGPRPERWHPARDQNQRRHRWLQPAV